MGKRNMSTDPFTSETTCVKPSVEETDWSTVWDSRNTINANEIITNLLFGLDLSDSDGNPFPKDMFIQHMDSAIAYVERQLGITIPETIVEDEFHDYIANDYSNWGFIKLNRFPIIEVNRLTMNFGSTIREIPNNWIRVDSVGSNIRLFPDATSPTNMAILSDGSILGTQRYPMAPAVWRVSYKAGFRKGQLPADLKECIQKMAAMNLLNVWGDLILGAGIASSSISLDGLSQSVGTTQSAMFGGASARVNEYKENVNQLLQTLKMSYSGIRMVVV